MIRFKCIYCGQKILAKDDGVGKRGKCPKCAHLLSVPESTKGRPAISPNKEPMPDRFDSPVIAWEDDLTDLCKEKLRFFIPTFDKLSLLLMAITLIMLYLANPQMIEQIRDQTQDLIYFLRNKILLFREIGFFVLLLLGAVFYQFFIVDEKTDLKKKIMLDLAVLISNVAGFFAGMYVIQNAIVHNWLLIFPIWNIINSILLLLMFSFKIIDEECISDRKATFIQVVLGLTTIVVIFLLCNYVFKLYWAITFSICIVYTTSFDRALQSVFPGLADRSAEVNS